MYVKCLPTGMFGSNCYILAEENSGEGVIIDAGVSAGEVMEVIEEEGISIKYIILTHGHIDHICCADEIKSETVAKVLIHEDDVRVLKDSFLNGSAIFGYSDISIRADRALKDGDILDIGSQKLEIIHTPGHTEGCICMKADGCIFTGDTLFRRSVGRTDLPGGNHKALTESIKNRLMMLDDNTMVYPGHGEPTSIGFERRNNPYI
jgi:hydroxyacylglutathione hydrolase